MATIRSFLIFIKKYIIIFIESEKRIKIKEGECIYEKSLFGWSYK